MDRIPVLYWSEYIEFFGYIRADISLSPREFPKVPINEFLASTSDGKFHRRSWKAT
jgi:hypothetical protein